MKLNQSWKSWSLLTMTSGLLLACGSDGGDRRIPEPNLNITPTDIRLVNPPEEAVTNEFCPSGDFVISVPKSQATCTGFVDTNSYMGLWRKDSVGVRKMDVTRGFIRANAQGDSSRCEVVFRPDVSKPENRLQRGTQYVLTIENKPSGSLGNRYASAEMTTVQSFEASQSCGGSSFIAGQLAGVSSSSSVPSMKESTWQNFGSYNEGTGKWNWSTQGIVRLGADAVREFAFGGILGLTYNPTNSILYIQMNEPVESWTAAGSINLIRIRNILSDGFELESGSGLFGSGVNLLTDCAPNPSFNADFPNSCVGFHDEAKTRLKIRMPGAGVSAGQYMLTLAPALLSASSGKNLKNAFVTVFNLNP